MIETLTDDTLTLAFVKTKLLDHEVKLKNESNDTSAKILHVKADDHRIESSKNQYFQKKNLKSFYKKNFKSKKII